MKRLNREDRLLSVALFGLVVFAILVFWPTSYHRISPGRAEPLGSMVSIEDYSHQAEGEIMLTAISMRNAKLLDYIHVKLFKPELVELQSDNFLPPGMDIDKYFEFMEEMMEESQMKAKAAALSEAGYSPEITGEGVLIIDVLEEGNAYGKLQEGDVIIAVDGQRVKLLTETIAKIQDREVGERVALTVSREEAEREFTLDTLNLEGNDGNPSIGVLIAPYNQGYNFPVEIDIDAGKIGGPSAGAMFALEIFNQLTEGDITKGVKVAGTGTIDLDGSVGKIDGARQKVVAAKRRGAKVFFLPSGNYKEAQELGVEGIEVVGVDNISEIIEYLRYMSKD